MGRAPDPLRAYLRALAASADRSVRTLSRRLDLDREAAAEVFAAAAALVPLGLARRLREEPLESWSVVETARREGRPADLRAPDLGLAGRLDREDLDPRLGRLLGEAGPRVVAWLAERTGAAEEDLGRALAAVAPLPLGALATALPGQAMADWVAVLPDGALEDPRRLLDANETPAEVFRRLRRHGRPWPLRLLGLEG